MNDSPHPTYLEQQLVALILRAFPLDTTAPEIEPLDDAQWQALTERSTFQGVSSLLFAALEQQELQVPSFVVETLQTQHRRSALAGAASYYALAKLLPEFTSQQIPVVLLKGAALAKWLYPAPALRPFGDLDCLIRQTHVSQVSAILRAHGYTPGQELAAGFRDAYYSEMSFARHIPPRTSVDLHWNLFVPLFYRRRMDLEWFWSHTQPLVFGEQSVLILDPAAQLVHLAVHASLNHQNEPRLIWLYDLALLIERYKTQIDWGDIQAFARASRLTRPIQHVLHRMQMTWGVQLPESHRTAFQMSNQDLTERIAFALTAATHNEARGLSDAMSAPGMGKLGYMLRHVFPSRTYMRQRYALDKDVWLPWYYARRVVETGWKFLRSIRSAVTR
jgi:hypothetical protein